VEKGCENGVMKGFSKGKVAAGKWWLELRGFV